MVDKAPDVFEFETLEVHPEVNEIKNNFILEEPPVAELDSSYPILSDEVSNTPKANIEEQLESSNNELLNLSEPPQEEEIKESTDISNRLTDEAITQFAQNLIDPIVKEAIEIQKAEMEENISDEIKIDSSGDKKSEKSSSDDGFEYVKDDDINASTIMDSNNEIQHNLYMECFNKDIEDESFLNESLKIDDRFDNNAEDTNVLFSSEDFKLEPSYDESQKYIEKEPCLSEIVKTEDEPYLCENIKSESCFLENAKIEEKDSHIISDDSPITEDLQSEVNTYDDSIVKVSEDDSFVKDISSEPLYAPKSFTDTNEDISPVSPLEDPDFEKADEFDDDDYQFDIQGIINASNMSQLPLESLENKETLVVINKSNINQKCKDIILWKDPILSSIVLSTVMLIELGLMCDYSIISLLAYSGLLLLGSSFCYKFAVKFNLLKKCGQSNCAISITADDIQISVDYVLKWIEYLFNEVRSLTYVVSFTKNLKAFTFFWILTYVGQWFNLLSLIFIGTITLFSLPIVYLSYEDTIDMALVEVRGKIQDSINKVKSKFQILLGRV